MSLAGSEPSWPGQADEERFTTPPATFSRHKMALRCSAVSCFRGASRGLGEKGAVRPGPRAVQKAAPGRRRLLASSAGHVLASSKAHRNQMRKTHGAKTLWGVLGAAGERVRESWQWRAG